MGWWPWRKKPETVSLNRTKNASYLPLEKAVDEFLEGREEWIRFEKGVPQGAVWEATHRLFTPEAMQASIDDPGLPEAKDAFKLFNERIQSLNAIGVFSSFPYTIDGRLALSAYAAQHLENLIAAPACWRGLADDIEAAPYQQLQKPGALNDSLTTPSPHWSTPDQIATAIRQLADDLAQVVGLAQQILAREQALHSPVERIFADQDAESKDEGFQRRLQREADDPPRGSWRG